MSVTGTLLSVGKFKLALQDEKTGTGDVADINAVTFAEFKAVFEADVTDSGAVLDESGFARIYSGTATTGSSSKIECSGGTARTKFGFDSTEHLGSATTSLPSVNAAYIKTVKVQAGKRVTVRLSVTAETLLYAAAKSAPSKVSIRQVA